MEGNVIYYKMEDHIDIYIKVLEKKINITIPNNDIFNVLLVFTKVIGSDHFSFHFDKFRFTKVSKNSILKKNMHTGEERTLKLTIISMDQYYKRSIKLNRVNMLKESYKYTSSSINYSYDFNNNELEELRKITNMNNWLDNNNEFSKARSILKWINDNLKHDGQLEPPDSINSIQLLKFASQNGGYLNCRGLAILMNELSLAASLYSKFIICMQKEVNIDDYHVLNVIYISELKKWILFDPSYNLYLKNVKNEILSVEDVRESLINCTELIPNIEANYNKDKLYFPLYKRSILKKFYRFAAPVNSTFGGDYLENLTNLVPNRKDFPRTYCTDNPSIFWMSPIQS